jgi:hypothetical protein
MYGGSNSRCFLTPITRLDAPETNVPAKCSLMNNETKMKEVRKAVTNYDSSDHKECKFLFSCVFTELASGKARSSTTLFSSPNERRVFLLFARV